MRGFPGIEARAKPHKIFYEQSRTWRNYRDQANATMIDSSDVLLLRSAGGWDGIQGPTAGGRGVSPLIAATLCYLDAPPGEDCPAFFQARAMPLLAEAGAVILGCLETEPAENPIPGLPREQGTTPSSGPLPSPGPQGHQRHLDRLARSRDWAGQVLPELERRLLRPPEHLRLALSSGPGLRYAPAAGEPAPVHTLATGRGCFISKVADFT